MKGKKTVAQVLGENLKRIRTEKGISRKDLAERLGVSYTAIASYENEGNLPTFEKILQLAEIFDVSIADLTGDNKDYIDKKIFEYRFNRAIQMAKQASYFPEILSTGKVIVTISNEIDHWENGTIAFSGGRDLEFKDKENFVNEMETAQGIALTFDLTFNEAMLLLQEQHRSKKQQKPKLTPNMQKIIRALVEQDETINKTPAE